MNILQTKLSSEFICGKKISNMTDKKAFDKMVKLHFKVCDTCKESLNAGMEVEEYVTSYETTIRGASMTDKRKINTNMTETTTNNIADLANVYLR